MSQLADIMAAASQDMIAQVKKVRAAFDHQATKGDAVEATLRHFFEAYYPASIGVAHGQVVDSAGNRSKQHDVILYDTTRTPILYTDKDKGQRLVPVEGVLAVVESKLSLQLADVDQVVESAKTLKSLKRDAYYFKDKKYFYDTQKGYGREYDVLPPMYFLFGFEGPSVESFAKRLEERQKNLPLDKRVDLGCVLGGGVMANRLPSGQLDTLPSPQSTLVGFKAEHDLLLFHLLASRYLLQVEVPPIALQRYIPRGFTFDS